MSGQSNNLGMKEGLAWRLDQDTERKALAMDEPLAGGPASSAPGVRGREGARKTGGQEEFGYREEKGRKVQTGQGCGRALSEKGMG